MKVKRFIASIIVVVLSVFMAVPAFASSGNYQVEYIGKANGLVSADGDLFAHFPTLMPGDTLTGRVKVLNSDAVPQRIYFYTEPYKGGNRIDADDLLDLIQLEIVSGNTGDAIYSGPLRANSMNEAMLLGAFARGEGDTLLFTVAVPADIGNEYAIAKNAVHWVFAAEEALVPGAPETGWLVTTGDSLAIAAVVVLSACALMFLIVAVCKRRKDRQH